MAQSWFESYYPAVQIPVLARIRETRGQIAEDIDTLFSVGIQKWDEREAKMIRQQVKNPWILAGPTTVHFAKEIMQHSKQFRGLEKRISVLEHKAEGNGFKQGYWQAIPPLVEHSIASGFDFILYVGSQNIADTAKAVASECKIMTGGVITAISSDGLFSDTAALTEASGLSRSQPTIAPYFVLAHGPTLVRSPSEMKAACVADILTNHSALWDHKYSTSHLNLPLSDIAWHFSQSAAALIDLKSTNRLSLCNNETISSLFRATELCGLSMQLNRGFDGRPNSATCSGSEHNIEKEVRKLLVARAQGLRLAGQNPQPVPLHGEILSPCLLLTLVLQGQTDLMVCIRTAFKNLGLPTKAADLGLDDDVFVKCVCDARGSRAPAFKEVEAGKEPTTEKQLDRLTVLENIEGAALVSSVKTAMQLAEIGYTRL